MRYIPLTGAPGSTVAVAWRRGLRGPGVEQFAAVAQQVRDRESAIVRALEAPPS
ncbi:hypothetical protein [Streptomyces sp. Ncost-T6T-1]|uniref:hypothetical protein n=1 Tax=Streptomyces sp. Ncost-T6T-1 TaxID=1100828 RepID=UPI001EFA6673|nr:hypothetical protein [Streptomyces sp. Ncost-T6T-1]